MYALQNNDENKLMLSSSGAVFSELCHYAIQHGFIVYGVCISENLEVRYMPGDTEEKCELFYGSKYVQANIYDTYKQIKTQLNNGSKVLFSGTPCQVKGLKNFLRKSYDDQLITVDFVCHGVPSQNIFRSFVDYIEKKYKSTVRCVSFRTKEFKWDHTLHFRVSLANGKTLKYSHLSQLFMVGFSKNIFLRPSCYNCKYTNFNRPSDLTMADFWGIEKITDTFNTEKGVSCLIVNTNKGTEVFDSIKSRFRVLETQLSDVRNPQLYHPVTKPKMYDEFWSDYTNTDKTFYDISRKYFDYDNVHILKAKLRRFKILRMFKQLFNK
jgi:coenzyme F420-reducing hydrogenase beta subunit